MMRFFVFSFLVCFLLLCGCRSVEPVQSAVPREKQLFVVIDDAGLALEETEQ